MPAYPKKQRITDHLTADQRVGDYCREHGYTIVTEECEVISGTFVLARSKFNELLTWRRRVTD